MNAPKSLQTAERPHFTLFVLSVRMLLSLVYLINEVHGFIHQQLLKNAEAPEGPTLEQSENDGEDRRETEEDLQEKLEACVVEIKRVKQEREALMLQVKGLQETLRKEKEAMEKARDRRIDLLLDALSQKEQLKKMQRRIQAMKMNIYDLIRVRDQWDASWL